MHLSLVFKTFGSLIALMSWTNRNAANRHLELPGNFKSEPLEPFHAQTVTELDRHNHPEITSKENGKQPACDRSTKEIECGKPVSMRCWHWEELACPYDGKEIHHVMMYPLTRNYYENNSMRIIFRNFEAILYPQNLRERRTFSRNYA